MDGGIGVKRPLREVAVWSVLILVLMDGGIGVKQGLAKQVFERMS